MVWKWRLEEPRQCNLNRFGIHWDCHFQISYIFQMVEPFIIDASFFFSLMRYTPNPGGGARGARQTGAAPGRGRATSCSVCSNSGLPIVDAICPFHQHQTEGLVRRSAVQYRR